MKTLICVAMALFAAAALGGEARAFGPLNFQAAKTAVHPAVKKVAGVSGRRWHGGLFGNWCTYNCYSVPRCYNGRCLGRYGYGRYAYDEDLPFSYRYDRDASPIDNGDAFVYRFTGAPVMRAFERIY